MNEVRGMSLSQFNQVIDDMRTIYPFDEKETYLSDLRDNISNSLRKVEIITKDKKTGVDILMSKAVDYVRESD